MKLTVKERIELSNLLPKEGNYLNLKLIRKLKEDLSFSEEEHTALEFKTNERMINWKDNTLFDIVEIEITPQQRKIGIDVLKTLDEKEKLTESCFSLYEKFLILEYVLDKEKEEKDG